MLYYPHLIRIGGIRLKIDCQTEAVVAFIKELFGDRLRGLYLYGSSVLGGLRPNSDIDLLVLIDKSLSDETRHALTRGLLQLSGRVGSFDKRPLEVTILRYGDVHPWHFPPVYEYMYGEWLREEIEKGMIPSAETDPDLAILLWQARLHSVTLAGEPASLLLPEVPPRDIRRAIRESLPGLVSGLAYDERNVLLTLSRMWFTLKTGKICPKDVAARWVLPQIPTCWSFLLEMAEKAYLGECRDCWKGLEEDMTPLADYMSKQIMELCDFPIPS